MEHLTGSCTEPFNWYIHCSYYTDKILQINKKTRKKINLFDAIPINI